MPFARTFIKEGLWTLFFEGAKPAIGAITSPSLAVLTVVAGYLQGLPWAYIIAAAALVFAAVSTGLLRFSEWLDRNRSENKFSFQTVQPMADFESDPQTGVLKSLKQAGAIISFHNSATFPISFIMDELFFSFEGRINPSLSFRLRNATVPPAGQWVFYTAPVDLGIPLKTRMVGTLNFKVRYGRPGHETHTIEKKLEVSWGFDPWFRSFTTTTQDML